MALEINKEGELETSLNSFQKELKDSYHLYFAGLFKVKGSGPVVALWPQISYSLSKEGRVALVEKGYSKNNGGRPKRGTIVLAKIVDISHDLDGNISDIVVRYSDEKATKEKNPLNYVVFFNDTLGEADLKKGTLVLNLLWKLWQTMEEDLRRSKARLIIKSPIAPADDKVKKLRDSFEKEIVVLGSQDDGTGLTLDKWEPKSNMKELLSTFKELLSFYEKINGIRHNTANKDERHISGEIDLVLDPFQYVESVKKQMRVNALKECEKAFGEGTHDYELTHN